MKIGANLMLRQADIERVELVPIDAGGRRVMRLWVSRDDAAKIATWAMDHDQRQLADRAVRARFAANYREPVDRQQKSHEAATPALLVLSGVGSVPEAADTEGRV
ncbi:MAG: hypothetical protein M5T61_21650, partial [Acidimicrobiia bacterium]|nr:hypothetical protein [Acidimicrobiia bacterium]